jgi:hypothetical protein
VQLRPDLPRIDPRFVVPAALACLTLFGGGLALGNLTGSSPTRTTTQTERFSFTSKGKVITVNGVKKVRLPARTITRKGKVLTIPPRTVNLVETQVHNGTVVVTTQVPTTVVRTQTNTQTQVSTQTVVSTVQLPPTTVVSTVVSTITEVTTTTVTATT